MMKKTCRLPSKDSDSGTDTGVGFFIKFCKNKFHLIYSHVVLIFFLFVCSLDFLEDFFIYECGRKKAKFEQYKNTSIYIKHISIYRFLIQPQLFFNTTQQNETTVSATILKKTKSTSISNCTLVLNESGGCGSTPRWPIRAMWHKQDEGANWLAEVYELGAEQLQQSLTITVSG